MSKANILAGKVGYELKRVQHGLRSRMDGELRGIGLTTPQYAALSVLRDFPGISGAELARRSFVTAQTMNQILSKLEGAGLVERERHPEHGRILQMYLTPEGKRLVKEAHGVVESIETAMLSPLGKRDRKELLKHLKTCADAMARGA